MKYFNAFYLLLLLIYPHPVKEDPIPPHQVAIVLSDIQSIKSYIQENFPARFAEVIKCESGFRQYDKDGKILKNYNKNGSIDYGIAQINSIHIPEAKKMGLDITKPEDNLKYAKYLLETPRGINHWTCNKIV